MEQQNNYAHEPNQHDVPYDPNNNMNIRPGFQYVNNNMNDHHSIPYDPNNNMNMNMNNQPGLQNAMNMYANPTTLATFTIPAGTILYHGTSTKETFDPNNFQLDDTNLVAYFTPDIRLAADYIGGCAKYPTSSGYIHKFRAKNNIERIFILSRFDATKTAVPSYVQKHFCSGNDSRALNGIGFFYPKRVEQKFTEDPNVGSVNQNELLYMSEFALCNPTFHLEYLSTQRCQAKRSLSDNYNFTL